MPGGGKGAYETVLVILAPSSTVVELNPTQVIKQVTKVQVKVNNEIKQVFKAEPERDKGKDKPKPKPKPKYNNPYCDLVPDNYPGSCHDRKDYDENTGLYPCRDGSNVKDWRDCKDAGKHPDEKKQPQQRICTTGMDAESFKILS